VWLRVGNTLLVGFVARFAGIYRDAGLITIPEFEIERNFL